MKEKRRFSPLTLLLAILVTLVALWVLVGQDLWTAYHASQSNQTLQSMYRSGAALMEWLVPSARAEEEQPALATVPPIQAEFAELYAQNSDLVGWLTLGEEINEPVVQRDNTYYLSHDYFGARDANGVLFLNELNRLNPRDDCLLIHGHNMRSGARFGSLYKYEDFEYARQYPIVTFRTVFDAQDELYVPFAVFEASMNKGNAHYMDITKVLFDLAADGTRTGERLEFRAYLDGMLSRSEWTSPVDVQTSDEVLLLVTCAYHYDNGRLVVACRRLRDNESAEEIRLLFSANPTVQ